jgi:hypothetical protein
VQIGGDRLGQWSIGISADDLHAPSPPFAR